MINTTIICVNIFNMHIITSLREDYTIYILCYITGNKEFKKIEIEVYYIIIIFMYGIFKQNFTKILCKISLNHLFFDIADIEKMHFVWFSM